MLSQWGEVEDFNYPRDAKTGKPRGWCWCKYEDQRSTILCVDNMNGAKLLQRTLRVDHCEKWWGRVAFPDARRGSSSARAGTPGRPSSGAGPRS